ncbi:hypothetical protein HNY73_000074 [Argiope bruennichi]|uniref:Uncharacterized protein n=1 Tax=Argiope bruennichi TaxID=94029 RepID=A0A8T0FY11_ARGBR|nr:hypothetical protein HNY73_000074 [Argiope bruennichi]
MFFQYEERRTNVACAMYGPTWTERPRKGRQHHTRPHGTVLSPDPARRSCSRPQSAGIAAAHLSLLLSAAGRRDLHSLELERDTPMTTNGARRPLNEYMYYCLSAANVRIF